MAPEQVAALPGTIGPAADIHALVVLLYHLLMAVPHFMEASTPRRRLTRSVIKTRSPRAGSRPDSPRRRNDLPQMLGRKPRADAIRPPRPRPAICGSGTKAVRSRHAPCRQWGTPGDGAAGIPPSPDCCLCSADSRHGGRGSVRAVEPGHCRSARLAEARRRAEVYERFSASTADQLGGFLRMAPNNQGKTTPGQITAALLKLRNSTNDLKSRGIVPVVHLSASSKRKSAGRYKRQENRRSPESFKSGGLGP